MGASSEAGRMAAVRIWATRETDMPISSASSSSVGSRPKIFLQLHGGAAHVGNFVHQMDRQADGLGLVGQGAFDGLLDPPRAVGGKFAAFGGVKPLDRFHQADVALADQIEQRAGRNSRNRGRS